MREITRSRASQNNQAEKLFGLEETIAQTKKAWLLRSMVLEEIGL